MTGVRGATTRRGVRLPGRGHLDRGAPATPATPTSSTSSRRCATSPPRRAARPSSSPTCASELMAAADTVLLPSDDTRGSRLPAAPHPPASAGIAAVVGGLAIVGATTSVAVAAQSALPGEALYPLKRAIENAQTGIRVDEAARAPRCWPTRPTGSTRSPPSAATGDLGDGAAIAATLNTFTEQAIAASDLLLADYADHRRRALDRRAARLHRRPACRPWPSSRRCVPAEARDELSTPPRCSPRSTPRRSRPARPAAGGIAQIPPVLISAGQIAEPTRSSCRARRRWLAGRPSPASGGKKRGEQGDGTNGWPGRPTATRSARQRR